MSKIEWTDKTLNLVSGCTKISNGCLNCYASRMHHRLSFNPKIQKYHHPFEQVKIHPEELSKIKSYKKNHKIFVCSMSDLFHEKVPDDFITDFIAATLGSDATFQILTKRAERLRHYPFPSNFWVGVTVESKENKWRIDKLKEACARIKFLSCEPLLGDLGELDLTGIDWVICGGESGPGARPMHPDWVRNIQRQCQEQGVPFFFKQWGEYFTDYYLLNSSTPTFKSFTDKQHWINKARSGDTPQIGFNGKLMKCGADYDDPSVYPVYVMHKVGKKKAGCLLDGKEYKEYPLKVVQE